MLCIQIAVQPWFWINERFGCWLGNHLIADNPGIAVHSALYVHGHQVGGTNPSLVEALGAGNAVLAHGNPFNRWVAGLGARYFMNEDECAACFDELLGDAAELGRMSRASRERRCLRGRRCWRSMRGCWRGG